MGCTARRALAALFLVLAWTAPAGRAAIAQERDLDIPIMVQTVPELPGARFSLDGRTFTADEHGLALITVDQPGTYRLEAPPERDLQGGGVAEFARWSDEVFEPTREIEVDSFSYLEAGFDSLHTVQPRFVDAAGALLGEVRSLTLIDDLGVARTFDDPGKLSIRTARVTVAKDGLRPKPVVYELGEVDLAGAAIASQPGRALTPPEGGPWAIELSFHGVRILGTDAFFGSPVGSNVRLEYPNGDEVNVSLEGGSARLEGLPPGDYVARVEAGGIPLSVSFSLPGSTLVEADVVTPTDLVLVLTIVLLVAAALLAARSGALRGRLQVLAQKTVTVMGSLTTAETAPEGVTRGGKVRILSFLRSRERRETGPDQPVATRAQAPPPPPREPAEALATKLQVLAEEIDSAAGALATLRSEKDVIESELTSERASLDALRSEQEASEAGLASERDAFRVERDGLRAEIEALRRDRGALQADLVSKLEALAAERDELIFEQDAARARIAAMESELGIARDGLASAEGVRAERDALASELDDLGRERIATGEQLKQALARLVAAEEVRADLDRAMARRDALSRELNGLVAERDQLIEEREEWSIRLHRLMAERDGQGAERDRLSTLLDRMGAEREQGIAERDRVSRQVVELTAARAEQHVALERLSAERDALSSERDELSSERHQHTAVKDALAAELDGLSTEIDGLSTERDRLAAERAPLRAQRDGLQRERDALNDKLKQALGQLVSAEEVRAERDQLKERLAARADSEKDPLHQALGRLVTAETIRAQREDLSAQVSTLRRENLLLQRKLRALQGEPKVQQADGDRVAPEPPPPAPVQPTSPERQVVRLEEPDAEVEEPANEDPWWKSFIHQSDRY